jgi:serine protease Do
MNDYRDNDDRIYEETFPKAEVVQYTDPAEAYVPSPKTKKRWFFKFAAYMVILTFISGATFGAGYLTAMNLGLSNQDNESGKFVNTSLVEQMPTVTNEGLNVTQVQPVITTVEGTTTIATIAKEVSPSIVTIASYSESTPGGFFGDSGYYGGTGSGIAFRIEGDQLYVVTNYHVIEGASDLDVIFQNGSKVSAKPLGFDSRMDIAVLALPLDEVQAVLDTVVLASFGDSDTVDIGELAVAIGNPLGAEYAATVTAGIISALGRDIAIDQNTTQINLIQTDAAINPGNSGGALLNDKGEVIGINSAKYVDESVEGIGFAIPINDASEILERILEDPTGIDIAYELSDDRAFLGVGISDITSEIYNETGMRFGVYISSVYPHSGAEEAGIEVGDIIYSINDTQIRNVQGLFTIVDKAEVNDIIEIGVLRDDELLTLTAPLYSYKDVMSKQDPAE